MFLSPFKIHLLILSEKKYFFQLLFMQLFSSDTTILSKKTLDFFPHENMKQDSNELRPRPLANAPKT